MKEIAFDLETTGLDPFKDRITAIGMVSNDENRVITDKDEKFMLERFWEYLKQFEFDGFKLIGFNNADFDNVFLNIRSMKHNVKMINLKWKTVDTRLIAFNGWKYKKGKLEQFSELIGYKPKYNGWSGKQIPLLWKHGDLDDLRNYVLQDALMTWFLYQRLKDIGLI